MIFSDLFTLSSLPSSLIIAPLIIPPLRAPPLSTGGTLLTDAQLAEQVALRTRFEAQQAADAAAAKVCYYAVYTQTRRSPLSYSFDHYVYIPTSSTLLCALCSLRSLLSALSLSHSLCFIYLPSPCSPSHTHTLTLPLSALCSLRSLLSLSLILSLTHSHPSLCSLPLSLPHQAAAARRAELERQRASEAARQAAELKAKEAARAVAEAEAKRVAAAEAGTFHCRAGLRGRWVAGVI